MPDAPPKLFDRAAWLHRRALRGLPREGADFVHRTALEAIEDRLAAVTRDFPRAALVWPGAEIWRETLEAHPKIGALEVEPPRPDETLRLEEGGYDIAVLGLTLHWANDPVGALIQMRRALKPDGLLIACGLGGETLAELRAALAEAEIAEEGGLSPRVSPMGEIRQMGALLQRAGLSMPVADADRLDVTYADPLALMRDVRAMGEGNALADRRRGPIRRATLACACALYAEHYPAQDGRVRATFEIVTLTGWAPGPNQPQPLRPGSAKTRLADALGVPELKTGDKTGPGGRA